MFKFLTYLFLFFLYFSDAKAEDDKEVYKHLNLFGEAFEKIKNNYVEEVPVKDLIESAIEGMLSSLDPHSSYLNDQELNELKVAMEKKDIREVADALTDILYVTYGAGHAFGIDLDKCFQEVQNSNMSKLGNDGRPIYNEKGKVMKGPNYFKPDLGKYVA